MAIFLYPFTERKSYSIVTPFEPNDFLSEPWPRITLHAGGADIERNYEQSNLERNAYAKRQMKKKIKKYETILQKVEMYKEKQNVEKCKKKYQEKKIWREIKVKIKILHMTINDPWSDHPKTRFWAYSSFSSINPNLAYITYFESPFGSNAGTWAKEFLP